MHKVTPFLWFNDQAEAAAKFYVSVLGKGPKTKITGVVRRGPGKAAPAQAVTVLLQGHAYTLFNGGPHFALTPAFSLSVACKTQRDVDSMWKKLLAGGGQESRCGWLTDRFGMSWQVVPDVLLTLLQDKDPARAQRAMQAMLQMKKLDIAALKKAAANPGA